MMVERSEDRHRATGPRPASEQGLDAAGGRSLYIVFVVTVAAVYASLLLTQLTIFAPTKWAFLLLLGLVYTLVGTYGDLHLQRLGRRWTTPAYYLFQVALCAMIAFESRGDGFFSLVPLPLVAQAAVALRPWAVAVVSTAIIAIFAAVVWTLAGFAAAAQAVIVYLPAITFMLVFSRVLLREARARVAIEHLATQLQEANRQLEAHAAQAGEIAVAAERTRLSRDLHDAVTQTLFSASLIAEVLPRIWQRNQDEGRRRLEELRQLTRGALAEMRMLLVELRPAALTDAMLGDLLRQLAEATTARARLPVKLSVEGQRPLPADVQVALYRIAQEALNNVAKHSGASNASISLSFPTGGIALCIADDGRGYDQKAVTPDRFGLGIMHERAEAIGASLEIDSTLGHGTQISVRLPLQDPVPAVDDGGAGIAV